MSANERLRCLPSISDLLKQADDLIAQAGHNLVAQTLREVLAEARADILSGGNCPRP